MVPISAVGFGALGIATSFLLYAFSASLTRANFTFQATHLLFIHLIDQPTGQSNRPDLRMMHPPDLVKTIINGQFCLMGIGRNLVKIITLAIKNQGKKTG
ncbi:hypothetical protein [Acetobacterium sp. K1/6]|uniref:hypothetical protein n=2 Tax=unclassified Acetobacterium TaxID=2638182 RepID=UPI0013A6F74D|nr:hypothetical protein [Acetobacterium sp. K1/6]MDZ5724616.1 hypothetical protein [Acetobacterium sp. K1/6]